MHTVSLGNAKGKEATPGKRVVMKYEGRLKSNNKVRARSSESTAVHLRGLTVLALSSLRRIDVFLKPAPV